MGKESPTKEIALQLESQFDALFNTPVNYAELAKRMSKTVAKKYELLALFQKHYFIF